MSRAGGARRLFWDCLTEKLNVTEKLLQAHTQKKPYPNGPASFENRSASEVVGSCGVRIRIKKCSQKPSQETKNQLQKASCDERPELLSTPIKIGHWHIFSLKKTISNRQCCPALRRTAQVLFQNSPNSCICSGWRSCTLRRCNAMFNVPACNTMRCVLALLERGAKLSAQESRKISRARRSNAAARTENTDFRADLTPELRIWNYEHMIWVFGRIGQQQLDLRILMSLTSSELPAKPIIVKRRPL